MAEFTGVYQPALEIRYLEFADHALVFTFNMDGKPHTTNNPRRMKHENLPTLLFQLADRGYIIMPSGQHTGFKSLQAHSPEYVQAKLASIP